MALRTLHPKAWRKAACFALSLALWAASAPARAEATALPIDFSPGRAPDAHSYLSETEYEDPSLSVRLETIRQDGSDYHVAYVDVAHPSQLRTAIAGPAGTKKTATTSSMARANNAVIAISGDYYAYWGKGYVVRQGEVIRKSVNLKRDLLFIDDQGDFHILRKPTSASFRKLVNKSGLTIVNAFSLGPALVMDGEKQTVYNAYGFSPQSRSQRVAIGQIAPLSYALVVVDGRIPASRGATHKQLAAFMEQIGCQQAYNLDGGGSATMVFGDALVNTLEDGSERGVSDIIYFATGFQAE